MAPIMPQPLLLQANVRSCPYTVYTPAIDIAAMLLPTSHSHAKARQECMLWHS